MQVKTFECDNLEDLEKFTNEFISNKKVNSIDYETYLDNDAGIAYYSVMIVYEGNINEKDK